MKCGHKCGHSCVEPTPPMPSVLSVPVAGVVYLGLAIAAGEVHPVLGTLLVLLLLRILFEVVFR